MSTPFADKTAALRAAISKHDLPHVQVILALDALERPADQLTSAHLGQAAIHAASHNDGDSYTTITQYALDQQKKISREDIMAAAKIADQTAGRAGIAPYIHLQLSPRDAALATVHTETLEMSSKIRSSYSALPPQTDHSRRDQPARGRTGRDAASILQEYKENGGRPAPKGGFKLP